MSEAGQSPHFLHLCMGRRDIASLLGVAHETVSRSFTALSEAGYLRVANRNIEVLDLDRLQHFARHTRGFGVELPLRGAVDAASRASTRKSPLPFVTEANAWHSALLAMVATRAAA